MTNRHLDFYKDCLFWSLYSLTIAFLLLWQGNLMIYACLMACMTTKLDVKWDLPQKFFVAWIAWAFFSCLFCGDWFVAMQGTLDRGEGWIIWFLITRLAAIYWGNTRSLRPIQLSIVVLSAILCLLSLAFQMVLDYYGNPSIPQYCRWFIPDVAMGSFAAISSVLLWSVHPTSMIFMLLPLLYSGSRAALVGIVVSVAVMGFLDGTFWKWRKKILIAVVALLAVLPFSPMFAKLAHINLSSMGHGARAQWALQSARLAQDMSITGYGLDQLQHHLRPAIGVTSDGSIEAQKTHNIFLDTLLQTGWIGFVFFVASIFSAAWIVWKDRDLVNVACFCGMLCWIIFGLMNPQGVFAHYLFALCLFGIRRTRGV